MSEPKYKRLDASPSSDSEPDNQEDESKYQFSSRINEGQPNGSKHSSTINDRRKCKILKNFDSAFVMTIRFICVYFENEAFAIDSADNCYILLNNVKRLLPSLCGQKVIDFTYNGGIINGKFTYHFLAMTQNGRVFGWGKNEFNQVKYSKAFLEYTGPVCIDNKIKEIFPEHTRCSERMKHYFKAPERKFQWKLYRLIACGALHNLTVTNENSIIIWGNNQLGQYGDGLTENSTNGHEIVTTVKNIKETRVYPYRKRKCLWTFTVIALITILGFTAMSSWVLVSLVPLFLICLATFLNLQKPIISIIHLDGDNYILENTKIVAIACGYAHNLVLFENGDLWGWGNNQSGQLAIVPRGIVRRPKLIFANVKQIAAAENYSLVLCHDGVLFTFGDNQFGQLGDFDENQYPDPLKLKTSYTDIATFKKISMGRKIENGMEVFEAWGLFNLTESRNEEKDDLDMKKMAKIIRGPKPVRCQSFNDFIERYSCLTYFMVGREVSPSIMGGEATPPNEPELIDQDELLEFQLVSGDEKPIEGVKSIHIHQGDVIKNTGVEGNITAEKVDMKEFTQIGKGGNDNKANPVPAK